MGEILRNRYQVVGKLGFGSTSTVWLARDPKSLPSPQQHRPMRVSLTITSESKHVAIKFYVQSEIRSQSDTQLETYKRIDNAP